MTGSQIPQLMMRSEVIIELIDAFAIGLAAGACCSVRCRVVRRADVPAYLDVVYSTLDQHAPDREESLRNEF